MSEHNDTSDLPPAGGRLPVDPTAASAGPRELVLVKQGERFVFRCEPGEEAALLRRLRALADDPEVNLSWFDAAVLSHQVGQRLAQGLKRRPAT